MLKTKEPLLFQMIDVSSIETPAYDLVKYTPQLIENLALSILDAGGLITPLLVKQTGLQSYQLINNYQTLEYLAVIKAKQLNPRLGEMVNAFVVADTDKVMRQILIIQNREKYN